MVDISHEDKNIFFYNTKSLLNGVLFSSTVSISCILLFGLEILRLLPYMAACEVA